MEWLERFEPPRQRIVQVEAHAISEVKERLPRIIDSCADQLGVVVTLQDHNDVFADLGCKVSPACPLPIRALGQSIRGSLFKVW
jgi:hypothetical protein